ncbi:MAG: hypothetical protein MI810_13025 [Flavobacteriales bacterium]|nr:hypothetical protein [Flavobacteriales bacterium]
MRSIITIVLLSLGFAAFSQELYDHRLDENKWENLREGIRYEGQEKGEGPGREWTYESKEDYNKAKKKYKGKAGQGGGSGGGSGDGYGGGDGGGPRPQENTYSPPPSSSPPEIDPPSASGFGAIGWVLMIVLIVALVVLIFYMFVNTQRDGKKIKGDTALEEVNPTEIPLTELQRLLQEALAKGDYRGAVRIYFIFIIRDLAQKNWIQWEKEKTNFHYLREMSGKNEFDDFNRSVSYFEIIWYGKREIDQSKFEQIKPNFTRFLDKLGVE